MDSVVKLYPPEALPPKFRYPLGMRDVVGSSKELLYPWFFFDPEGEVGRLMLELARKRGLVPFASLELGDGDTACFDGADTSADPAVVMLITDGSDRSYAFSNFDSWLVRARADAEVWSARK